MVRFEMQQVPPQPVPGDMPPPPPVTDPIQDPTQPLPPVQDPDVIDPTPAPLTPPRVADAGNNDAQAQSGLFGT